MKWLSDRNSWERWHFAGRNCNHRPLGTLRNVLDAFRAHLADSRLIPEDTRVLVGYSGGADSTCLLHLLHRAGIDIIAAHLHHGQREAADKEVSLCQALCTELGVPFLAGKADVPRMAKDLSIGIEEAGRNARYAFFRQAAFQSECDQIATAHTSTDQVETIIFNLVRGSGLAGLAGIPERRENIIRPLLIFSRQQTRAYCDAHGLWYHDDPTNEDLSFSRARVRLRLLPELRLIHPAAEQGLLRLAAIAGEEDDFLNGMAAAALEQSEVKLNGDLHFLTKDCEVAFDRSRLSTLPRVLFKRALRLAVEALGSQLDFDQTRAVSDGIITREKGSITSEGGEVALEWNPDLIHARQLRPTSPFRHALDLPGQIVSEEFGWSLTTCEAKPSGQVPERTGLQVEVDADEARLPLHFRTFKDGDKIRPLGFSGHRKISDLLSEASLTDAARKRLPIVCDLVGPIWVPNICLDERVRTSQETQRAVLLRFGAETET